MNNFQKFYFDITGFRDEMKGAVKRYQVTIKELERFKGSAGYDAEEKGRNHISHGNRGDTSALFRTLIKAERRLSGGTAYHLAIHCQRRSRLQLYKP